MTKKQKVALIIERLSNVYRHPKTALDFSTPMELLVATMLSAQTTDKLVNLVTPQLFTKYPSVNAFANADFETLDRLIGRVNFHRNKARAIIASAKIILTKHNGIVPDTMAELDALPGVARKTANVVLGNAYHKSEGIAVDTHVIRLANKLGLTTEKDPVKIERDLMNVVPKEAWIVFSHLLILHGRDICTARTHTCAGCPLGAICPDKKNTSTDIL